MRSKRHYEIQLYRLMHYIDEASEQKRQGQRPCVIGDQNQHPLIRELSLKHAKSIAYFVIREQSPSRVT